MDGRMTLADVPEHVIDAVKSSMQFPIYRHACEVLSLPSKQMRRDHLDRIPAQIREMVETEARRVYALRMESAKLKT